MSIIEFYLLFAITTAVYAMIELLNPVMAKHKADTGKTMDNPILLRIVFFVMALLTAPYLFICCIIPERTMLFREGLYKGLTNK